jgi:hypothetical protein
VGIGVWAEDAGDEELGAGELRAEQGHEGDGAAFADVEAGLAEPVLGGLFGSLLEPGGERRGVPAFCGHRGGEAHVGVVRRLGLELLAERFERRLRIAGRRQPERKAQRGLGAEHVAAFADAGDALGGDDFEGRQPGAGEDQLGRVAVEGLQLTRAREAIPHDVADDLTGLLGLLFAILGDRRVELARQQLARLLVLDPREELARDAEARRHDAACIARVHALGQDLDLEIARARAAERSRAPELLEVAGARVETDHEARRADAIGEVIEVGGQVIAAALFAALDEHDAAGVLAAGLLQRAQRRDAGEDRITVIGAAATVELVVPNDGLPGAEALVPTLHLGLLVEVTIEQDDIVLAGLRGVGGEPGR